MKIISAKRSDGIITIIVQYDGKEQTISIGYFSTLPHHPHNGNPITDLDMVETVRDELVKETRQPENVVQNAIVEYIDLRS